MTRAPFQRARAARRVPGGQSLRRWLDLEWVGWFTVASAPSHKAAVARISVFIWSLALFEFVFRGDQKESHFGGRQPRLTVACVENWFGFL